VIWRASDRSFSWRPNGLKLELEGSILTVRQGGTSFQIDVASPTVEMTLHHFAVGHGSFLRLRTGTTEVTVGVQAYATTDSRYSDEPLRDYRFSLAKADFETLHGALADIRRAVFPLASSDPLRERRSFMLRGNTNAYRGLLTAGLVVGSVVALATIAINLLPSLVLRHSEVLIVIGQIGIALGLLRWFWWSMQQAKPALLIVQGQTLTLSRLKPPMTIRSWKRSEADVKLTVWKSPSSRFTSSQLFPVVEVWIRNALVVSVALHAQKPLARRAPRPLSPLLDRLALECDLLRLHSPGDS
jgi:hypothetical protein